MQEVFDRNVADAVERAVAFDNFREFWNNLRGYVIFIAQTDNTSDSIADLVASNYFIERRQGRYARGVITLRCSQE